MPSELTFCKGDRVEVYAAWIDRWVPASVLNTFDGPSRDYLLLKFDADRRVEMVPKRAIRKV